MKYLPTFENFVNEGKMGTVVFSVNDDKLDSLLNTRFGNQLDYQTIQGDSYYELNQKDFEKFVDLADSSGYDIDSVIQIQESSSHTHMKRINESSHNAEAFAQKIAKFLEKKLRTGSNSMTVTAGSVEVYNGKLKAFDLDLDGVEYDGGSYIINDNGDIVNAAAGNAIYGNIKDVK